MFVQRIVGSLLDLLADGVALLRPRALPDGADPAAHDAPAAAPVSLPPPSAPGDAASQDAARPPPPAAAPTPTAPRPLHAAPAQPAPADRPGRAEAGSGALAPRDDPAAAALREKIDAARQRLDTLVARKAQMEDAVLRFQVAQYEALGPSLECCLGLRLEYLRLKAERSGTEADGQAAREAEAAFDACHALADDVDVPATLDDESRTALRQLYRSAAMRCHPDRVAEADKARAAAMFLRVQQAYRAADLPTLRALCLELDTAPGVAAEAAADAGLDLLRRHLDAILDTTADVMLAIQAGRLDPLCRQAHHPASWATEFAETRARLDAECDELRWQIRLLRDSWNLAGPR